MGVEEKVDVAVGECRTFICSPFSISELILKKTNSDIYKLKEGSLIEANLHIRKSLKHLKNASYMLKAIASIHFHSSSLDIYLLLKTYLKKLLCLNCLNCPVCPFSKVKGNNIIIKCFFCGHLLLRIVSSACNGFNSDEIYLLIKFDCPN